MFDIVQIAGKYVFVALFTDIENKTLQKKNKNFQNNIYLSKVGNTLGSIIKSFV